MNRIIPCPPNNEKGIQSIDTIDNFTTPLARCKCQMLVESCIEWSIMNDISRKDYLRLAIMTFPGHSLCHGCIGERYPILETPEQVGPEYVVNSGAYHFLDKNESTIGDDLIESNDAKRKLKGGFKKFMSERTIMTSLGNFLEQDIDCMPLNPLENIPEVLRRQNVIVDKSFNKFNETRPIGWSKEMRIGPIGKPMTENIGGC
ncbi:Protein ALWAYS EARLY 1 [Acorus calamus]|uniref:Protein ALWAYS EARLY 1 n=1 Tax=Acorus calamus TaxID=4465 RepID=A0AAV9EID7_ACOCL|nr:Protein ALWAYS EARLY 1 [Acorus calamus]